MLQQDTTHFIERPCHQRGSPCQDPAGNRTTRRLPDHCKETQTEVVWSCLPFISLPKTILQGTVKGGRRQGRQRKRWEDNIREWANLEFAKSQRAVEIREEWRKLVVKSPVVPLRPSRSFQWFQRGNSAFFFFAFFFFSMTKPVCAEPNTHSTKDIIQ